MANPASAGPRGLPLLGMTPMMARDILRFLDTLAANYGDIVPFRTFQRSVFLIKHPDHIREILVTRQNSFTKSPALQRVKVLLGEGLLTNEGDSHTRQRRLVQPAFHREQLEGYGAMMTAYAVEACARLSGESEVDIRDEMMRLTLRIVARTLFDADVEGDAKNVGTAMKDLLASFDVVQLPFANLLRKLPLKKVRREQAALQTINEIVGRIIAEHRAVRGQREDLLSALLAIRDEDGGSLSDEQIHDEILTLFVAGHETTALTLTWTWYLLAQYPEQEAKLHAELESVLGGRTPTFSDIPKLIFLEQIISETLRLYPVAWLLGRMAKENVEIGGSMIPAGAICLLSQYVTQRDPRFFPDPQRFDPQRWQPEARETRPKFSFFPFGGGKRVCIGERFAIAELILVIATIAQKWRFQLINKQPPKLKPRITLGPSRPIRMRVLAR